MRALKYPEIGLRVALVSFAFFGATIGCSDPAGTPANADAAPEVAAESGPVEPTCPTPKGPTVHAGGDLSTSETWTAEGSPHVVEGDLRVRDGATLTIEPCAVVQMKAGVDITVAYPITPNQGTLLAEGTADKPIRFEGLDGARWGMIYVHHPGTARLAHVTLDGGGGEGAIDAASLVVDGDTEVPKKTALFVDHVTIKRSLGTGLRIRRGAALAAGSTDLVITESGNDENPWPIVVGEQAIDSVPTGRYVGNKVDEILVISEVTSGASGLMEDATMHERGVPWRMGKDRFGNLHVGAGPRTVPIVTLTIEPGVTLKMSEQTAIFVNRNTGRNDPSGRIVARGTAERPIVFTSAQKEPKPGDWRGFWFGGEPNEGNVLDHVRIEYTGFSCSCTMVTCNAGVTSYEAALIFMRPPPAAFLTNSVIAKGSGHGVVQGYDGAAFDWKSTNTFEDLGGCRVTLPRNDDTSCPNPRPACD
jgi:hypothetical protein